jgi:multisubunit Na+/H+ antiporter MnhE subunit
LWLLFVATWQWHELLIGLFACTVTTSFTWHIAESTGKTVALRIRDILQGWRIPWYIVTAAYEIMAVLAKDLTGIERARDLYRVCGFQSGTHDPLRIARAALAVAYTSATPGSIVIGIDPAQSRMLFHQLKRSGIPKMTRELGARP